MNNNARIIQYGKTTIPFRVASSRRSQTIAVTVKPDMSVCVVVPRYTRRNLTDGIVRGKAAWIIEQWDQQRQLSSSLPREFCNGESFRYLGRSYCLNIRHAEKSRLRLVAGRFDATVVNGHDSSVVHTELRDMFIEWYRARAVTYLPSLVAQYCEQLGIVDPRMTVVLMKTRWGSCSSRSLRFNWKIMMAPRLLVRYVVAHEVCHLRYADHSKQFWRLLEKLMPDYRQRHAELMVLGPRLTI